MHRVAQTALTESDKPFRSLAVDRAPELAVPTRASLAGNIDMAMAEEFLTILMVGANIAPLYNHSLYGSIYLNL
jgi:hypothetical protein